MSSKASWNNRIENTTDEMRRAIRDMDESSEIPFNGEVVAWDYPAVFMDILKRKSNNNACFFFDYPLDSSSKTKYVYDNKLTNKKSLKIETLAGIKTLELNVQDGQVFEVTVDMGEPILEPRKIPVNSNLKEFINQEIKVNDTNYFATCVSMGNPHTIIFVKDVDKFRVCEIGKEIENNKELFPQKTNVEFIEVLDAHNLRMRVWERGSGETLACGTGACASLVAGPLNNLCKSQAFVYLKGGILNIKWDKKTNHVFLTGGATKVFDGNFTINEE